MVNLTDIAALINFDYTDESRAEIYPIDPDSSLLLFANIQESTNTLLEYDTIRADDCQFGLWDLYETPLQFWLVITNVKKGALWVPGDGPLPNGSYTITQAVGFPCKWLFIDADFSFLFELFAATSRIRVVSIAAGEFAFTKTDAANTFLFTNSLTVPAGNHFYGGFAQLWEL